MSRSSPEGPSPSPRAQDKPAPLRTCVGCRSKRPQPELLRLHWQRQRVEVDAPGRRSGGRGAYLCANMTCWERARKGRTLARALRVAGEGIDIAAVAETVAVMISGSPHRSPSSGPTPSPGGHLHR
ncbi:MAG: YlxR family protein [Candidatus Dormibacteria bacterium]